MGWTMVRCPPNVADAGIVVVGASWIGRVVAGMVVVAGGPLAGVVAVVAGVVVAGVVAAGVTVVPCPAAIGIPQVPQNRAPAAVRCPESHRLSCPEEESIGWTLCSPDVRAGGTITVGVSWSGVRTGVTVPTDVDAVAGGAAVVWRSAIGTPQVAQNREPTGVRCPASHRLRSLPPQVQTVADPSSLATG